MNLGLLKTEWKGYWRLTKHRKGPIWPRWAMTLGFGLFIGLQLTLFSGLMAGRLTDGAWMRSTLAGTTTVALTIALFTERLYRGAELLLPQALIDRLNGRPTLGVSAFFGSLSTVGALSGWMAGVWLLSFFNNRWQTIKPWELRPQDWGQFLTLALIFSASFAGAATSRWRKKQLELKATEAQLKLLQAQIEPHFLFNTLANVRSLIDVEPRAAGELLDAFTDHLRVSLTHMRAESVPLEQELTLVGHYLKLMQLRMCERLSYRIEADEAVRAHPVPPLLLQPLVENAIHHGLECSVEPGTVVVRAQASAGRLRLTVEDDGVGLDSGRSRKGNGVATQNIRERLKTRWGEDAQLRIEPRSPRGVTATLEFPLSTTA